MHTEDLTRSNHSSVINTLCLLFRLMEVSAAFLLLTYAFTYIPLFVLCVFLFEYLFVSDRRDSLMRSELRVRAAQHRVAVCFRKSKRNRESTFYRDDLLVAHKESREAREFDTRLQNNFLRLR